MLLLPTPLEVAGNVARSFNKDMRTDFLAADLGDTSKRPCTSSSSVSEHVTCAAAQEITDNKKLPKLLLQSSLRPILASLGSYNKLNLAMLRGLAHLLELLSSWFNITLGARNLWMSAVKLLIPCHNITGYHVVQLQLERDNGSTNQPSGSACGGCQLSA